ncbi:MAG TPA: cysteine desulfurase [Chromatiaceae bacterium]|nr:cysteine desulfurase [Chromatiaceae bacterium]
MSDRTDNIHDLDEVRSAFNVERIRRDFPILHQEIYGQPLVYLDNAATMQKPNAVIDAMSHFYATDYANVHRGVHALSQRADAAFQQARKKVQTFINADDWREIVFVRGATEAINLVVRSYGGHHINAGDEILITEMEHHANIVPWQMLCDEVGCVLRVCPINDAGEIDLNTFEQMLNRKTKMVAVAHVSNALGTINPVREIVELAHAHNIPVLLDGAQAVPHTSVDVQALDCDFYVFSGHKLYAPSGIGVLYGKAELLESMPPWQGGGDMIMRVTFEGTQFNRIPYKFEAGTPDIVGVIGLAAAIDYIEAIGLGPIAAHEEALLQAATDALNDIEGVRIIGTAANKSSVLSFVIDGVHPHDIGTIMDKQGIAIRAGHHCAMPVMQHFCVPATARASFAVYNTMEEVAVLASGIHNVIEVFA